MRPIAFSMHFRGHSRSLSPGVLTARARAPRAALVTGVDDGVMHQHLDLFASHEALLECRLTFFDNTSFEEVGTISFGDGDALRFRSVGEGTLEASPDVHLRHGAVTWRVDGGAGVFAGATGRIVSNFLLSDTGDLTDHQLGVVFLRDADTDCLTKGARP